MLAPLLHLDASSYCHGRGIFTFLHNLIMDVDVEGEKMMFYDFGNGSQELSLHQKLPTPKQLYFYILWIGCKDIMFEMFEMFFFSFL